MRQILENCWAKTIEVHGIFIDLQAAYDTVWGKE